MTIAMKPDTMARWSIQKSMVLSASATGSPTYYFSSDAIGDTDGAFGGAFGWRYLAAPMGDEIGWYPLVNNDGSTRGHGLGWTDTGVGSLFSVRVAFTMTPSTGTTDPTGGDNWVHGKFAWSFPSDSYVGVGRGNAGYQISHSAGEVVLNHVEQRTTWQTVTYARNATPTGMDFVVDDYRWTHPLVGDMKLTVRLDIQQLVPNVTPSAVTAQPDPQTLAAHARNSTLTHGS